MTMNTTIFALSENTEKFKITPHPYVIRMTSSTKIYALKDYIPKIPMHKFWVEKKYSQPLIITGNVTKLEGGGGLREETAENKSCLADVEVKLLGFDAMIKILSRRRPGQLIKTIAALEDLHLSILHTNITTMEKTVLYSFNVKARYII
ncbi:hypothetical protein ISN44_As08g026490 [Arabidopsis suecica]|uniref:Plant bHLH transcription factor ACT-like domain-containing protein n=1 Tax=Arabidopsis suecica TaxID=45249 RepID=A0A8T2B8R6_ARASU|nr:hypothetical protein ISN44_As08g026490 [Arabidopsis suecica]